jgi:hypothetical protein
MAEKSFDCPSSVSLKIPRFHGNFKLLSDKPLYTPRVHVVEYFKLVS